MKSLSLDQQLLQVSHFLIALSAGSTWNIYQNSLKNEHKNGVQQLSFAVLRQLGLARGLAGQLLSKQPPAPVHALLTAALGMLCAQREPNKSQGAIFAEHVIVSQAVQAAKSSVKLRAFANLINACLRRFLREKEALIELAQRKPEARWAHPAWWVERLQKDWPENWQAILQKNTFLAPLTLRINTSKCSFEQIENAQAAIDWIAIKKKQRVADCGLEIQGSLPISQIPGYSEGWFSVQDAAAQLAAPLLLKNLAPITSRQPYKILDACAAPGGKTTHLLQWAAANHLSIEVTALDVDAERCQTIEENLTRLGFEAKIIAADAAQTSAWHDGNPFDGILLDAPCTASGIVRRHPDIPWLRRKTDVENLAAQQKRLLNALWPLLKPSGVLLYATCSVFKAEGQDQIAAFVANNTQAIEEAAPHHLLPGFGMKTKLFADNPLGEHDGFFYALLRKAG